MCRNTLDIQSINKSKSKLIPLGDSSHSTEESNGHCLYAARHWWSENKSKWTKFCCRHLNSTIHHTPQCIKKLWKWKKNLRKFWANLHLEWNIENKNNEYSMRNYIAAGEFVLVRNTPYHNICIYLYNNNVDLSSFDFFLANRMNKWK